MAAKKGKKDQYRPPDGRIRLSQLVTTFGPGAMVDLVDHAVLVGGLDYWRYDSKKPRPTVDEPRLRDAVLPRVKALGLNLAQGASFLTGPGGNDDVGPTNPRGARNTWRVTSRRGGGSGDFARLLAAIGTRRTRANAVDCRPTGERIGSFARRPRVRSRINPLAPGSPLRRIVPKGRPSKSDDHFFSAVSSLPSSTLKSAALIAAALKSPGPLPE